MMSNPRILILLPMAVLLLAGATRASTADAEQRLQGAVNEALAVAKAAPDNRVMTVKLRPVLQKHINFETMTRRAVGPGWRQFSPAQRAKATDLFTTLVIRSYCEKLTPGEYPVIKFKTAKAPEAGRCEIPTTLTYQGSNYDVTYRLEGADNWRVSDIIIEGVSLVANYRTQFDAVFKKGGAEAVIDSLTQTVGNPR